MFSQSYLFDSIPDYLKSRADAVIRSKQCVYTITKPGNAVMKIKNVITLLNDNANNYRTLRVSYNNYTKVKNIRGTVYDEKGNIIKVLGMKDVFDMSAVSGATFYSDERVKKMYFPLYRFPYTIEYEYEVTYTSILNYPTWLFQDSPDVAVQRSGIQIIIPEDMKLRYYEKYMGNNVDSVLVDGMKVYTWQEENIPAHGAQDFSIRQVFHSPVLYTAPYDFEYAGFRGSMRSWKEFGNWVYEINKNRDVLPEEEITTVKDIVSKASNQREKIKLIYEYMQSKTRYVSIQIGIGGYQTAEASVVSENGFGDCKALVNYTSALLKAVDIESYFALVEAGTNYDINKDFINNPFNHVILCVPMANDTIWLECTNQTNPFNYLSHFTADKTVLLLTPEGGKIVKTPGFSKDQSIEKRTATFYMSSIGTSAGKIDYYYSGYNYAYTVDLFSQQSEDEIKELLYPAIRFTDFSLSSVTFTENKTENPNSQLTYSINIKSFATAHGPRLYFNPSIYVQDYFLERPLHFYTLPDITSDSIIYNMPPNYQAEYMPDDVNIESEFGKFIFNLETKGDKLILTRILELNKSDVTPERYPDFRKFFNTVAKADRKKVILIRSEGV